MSYRIGQFRRSQLNSYQIDLQQYITNEYSTSQNIVNEETPFLNVCGILSGEGIVNNQNCYYLQFGVQKRDDSEQKFYLKLVNTSEIEDNEQLIEEFTVKKGNGTVYFEIILSPNATYNQIVWELQRTPLDYRMLNNDDSYGRKMNIIINNYSKLVDIISFLKSNYNDMQYLTKIGIQGPPSLLMCINREQIRLGKTGIYEINNGINITSISFVPKNSILSSNNLDYFIMDFEY